MVTIDEIPNGSSDLRAINKMQSGGGVRRGDIVWAMVQYPHKWIPALVRASDNLGISVSFFNDAVFRSYFVESEVLPFEDPFPSLMSLPSACDPLFRLSIRSALRLFGQRLISGFRCPCQAGQAQAQAHRARNGPGCSPEFDPVGVLGFVLDAAISPSVEPSRFAHAVRVVAQVHAFRACSSIRHKKIYKQTPKTGDNVKLHPCLSFGQKIQLVTKESVALEPKEKYQIMSKQGETNMAIGAPRRLNSAVAFLEGNSEHLFKNGFLIISDNLMPPALDPFYMVRESLRSERQSFLKFKTVSDQGIVDIRFQRCSVISKTNISDSSNLTTDLSNYINKRKDKAKQRRYCRLLDLESDIYLNRKRRRLDKPSSCYATPQIGRVQENEGNAYVSKYTRPWISNIKMLEPEGSVQKDIQVCTSFCKSNMNFNDKVQKVVLKRSRNLTLQRSLICKSSSNLVPGFDSDNCGVDGSTAEVAGLLGSNSSVYQERLQMSCNIYTKPLESKRSARMKVSSGYCLVESKYCNRSVPLCSMFNSKVGRQLKAHAPFTSASLYMKFPRNFNLPSKEQLIKKFSVFGPVDSSKTRVSWYTGSAQVAFSQEADAVAAYVYAKKKVWFGEANVRFWLDPFEHQRRRVQCSANKQVGPPLKSCLKNSNSPRQENRKKHYRVRFTLET